MLLYGRDAWDAVDRQTDIFWKCAASYLDTVSRSHLSVLQCVCCVVCTALCSFPSTLPDLESLHSVPVSQPYSCRACDCRSCRAGARGRQPRSSSSSRRALRYAHSVSTAGASSESEVVCLVFKGCMGDSVSVFFGVFPGESEGLPFLFPASCARRLLVAVWPRLMYSPDTF